MLMVRCRSLDLICRSVFAEARGGAAAGVELVGVALARKLATALHQMWVDGAGFRFGKEVAAA